MSTTQEFTRISEKEVMNFLQQNPDFFDTYPHVLADIKLRLQLLALSPGVTIFPCLVPLSTPSNVFMERWALGRSVTVLWRIGLPAWTRSQAGPMRTTCG